MTGAVLAVSNDARPTQSNGEAVTNVLAIVVTYNSDIDRLKACLCSLKAQSQIIVIDNSISKEKQRQIKAICNNLKTSHVCLGKNVGIAAAQNIGIRWAQEHLFSDLILADDDSQFPDNFVASLCEIRASLNWPKVVISAQICDSTGRPLVNRLNWRFSKVGPVRQVREMTSSGTLIPVQIFEYVGPFDERLFIDCVDYEWGWRAIRHGVKIYEAQQVKLNHVLGEYRVLGMAVPAPVRHYYQVRNVFRLAFGPKAPLLWRPLALARLLTKFVLICLVADHSRMRLKFGSRGLADFFRNRSGAYRN